MAVPEITPAALLEVQRLVANEKASRPVVHVSWDQPQVDNKRGATGEAVWTRVSEAKWKVFVLDWDDPNFPHVKDERTIKPYDLEFSDSFLDRHGRPLRKPLLDFQEGCFALREAAI
jgi:hypothetical protein